MNGRWSFLVVDFPRQPHLIESLQRCQDGPSYPGRNFYQQTEGILRKQPHWPNEAPEWCGIDRAPRSGGAITLIFITGALGVDVKVILTRPCIFCMENH
jgi:hypothetical protein